MASATSASSASACSRRTSTKVTLAMGLRGRRPGSVQEAEAAGEQVSEERRDQEADAERDDHGAHRGERGSDFLEGVARHDLDAGAEHGQYRAGLRRTQDPPERRAGG